ncbi:alkaline phosphatase D family protein [Porticoccus sp. GXU_MW_L64]
MNANNLLFIKLTRFLRPALLIIAALFISACAETNGHKIKQGDFQFPQGVASADPQPTSVMLWTRVVGTQKEQDSINLTVEIAKTREFKKIEQTQHVTAHRKDDFTLRFYAQGLEPHNTYFYRFTAGKDTSTIGRTFTAPDTSESATLNFSSIACSSYEQGFFGTLKRLIEEDKAKPESEQIQLMFHVGDFIYEVVGDDPRQDNHSPNWLKDANGNPREITPFPDGKQWPDSDHWKSGSWSPVTVDDYRHLYKTYISNPVMQEARARWPFVYTWDDHEFADGNYQSGTYIKDLLGMPGMQTVKVASNQAWFEYLPSTLGQASNIETVKNQAHDFKPVEVENVPLGTDKAGGLFSEANNLKAINSMRMYRAIQWGKDVVIVVTDTKSYQDPDLSVLGRQQKEWFLDVLKTSPAKWKLWLNSEPFMETYIDYDNVEGSGLPKTLVYKDSWKTLETERREILDFIEANKINGVVSLSGDYHIQMAATVNHSGKPPVMADFAVTALSSFPDIFWLERKGKNLENPELHPLFSYQDDAGQTQPNINTTVMYGVQSGLEMAKTNDFNAAIAKANPSANPHLRYFDTEHNGYLTGTVNPSAMGVTFTNTKNARVDYEASGAEVVSRVKFELPHWQKGQLPALSEPKYEGDVFPMPHE